MDFSPQILKALQDKLDILEAFPIVHSMTPQTMELFVGSLLTKLHKKINEAMQTDGEKLVALDDSLGLSLMLIRNGIKLPPAMILEISKEIIKNSRMIAKWIAPAYEGMGDIWYCKMYIN